MRSNSTKSAVLFFGILSTLTLFARPSAAQTFPGTDGWLWYHDPAHHADTPKPPTHRSDPAPGPRPVPASDRPFSTVWIKENLDKLRDKAIEDPTPANVRAYLLLQRVAVDRSQQFAEVSTMVTQGDPALDENARFPLASAAAQQHVQQTATDTVSAIQSLSQTSGLFFFFRSDCPYCHADLSVLRTLELTTGIKITAISLDGQGIDPSLFPDYVIDNGQAARLGVQAVPAFYLVRPPDLSNVVELGQGYLALPDMQKRIVEQAYYHGWLSTNLYKQTRIAAPAYVRAPANPVDASLGEADLDDIRSAVERLDQSGDSLPSTPVTPRPGGVK